MLLPACLYSWLLLIPTSIHFCISASANPINLQHSFGVNFRILHALLYRTLPLCFGGLPSVVNVPMLPSFLRHIFCSSSGTTTCGCLLPPSMHPSVGLIPRLLYTRPWFGLTLFSVVYRFPICSIFSSSLLHCIVGHVLPPSCTLPRLVFELGKLPSNTPLSHKVYALLLWLA